MRLRDIALTLLALALVRDAAAQQAQSDTVLTVADYLDYERVSDPQIAPDGSRIVYTRRWVDKLKDKWESALWIVNGDGARNRFLVKGSNPRWSPDGTRVLYLAEGEPEGPQIYVRWMDAEGATSQITRVAEAPRNPAWSPDGNTIAFAMLVPAEEEWNIDIPKPPKGAEWTEAPRIIDRLHYRQDRVGFMKTGFMHLFTVTAEGGTSQQLTSGEWNVGARFDGLVRNPGFDWTPDGSAIVFDGLMEDGDLTYQLSHIYRVQVATKQIRRLTTRAGFWRGPVVSPSGQSVAFTGYPRTSATYTAPDIYVMGTDGASPRSIMGNFDRPPSSLHWARDGSGVYFTAQDEGSVNVHFASAQGGVRAVTSGTHALGLSSLSQRPAPIAVGTRSDFDEPGDIVRINLGNGTTRQLTSVNDDLLFGKQIGEVEEIWYTSSGNTRVQGWVVKPPDFDGAQRYPLIMEIHGGPFAMYSVGFDFRFQTFAANGYVVLYTNPRGSTGYGEDFSRGIDHAYPSVDYDDLMAGVDEVISRGYVDTTRMYVGGCSGGGVLSSWVIGHTDRFAAAAVRCPVTNWLSMAGQSDIPQFTHSFFHTPFWEDPSQWLEKSSLMYVGNMKTPTLVMTGELDLRTPMPQSEELFAALKMRGVEAKLLRFREEFHGTGSRPSNSMRTMLYMMSWYEQHAKAEEAPRAAEVSP